MTSERDLVFNIVWTGTVFEHLRYFVASQIDRSEARFRFLVNGCPPAQRTTMERFAEAHPDRVVEVLEVSADRMARHGDVLDLVRRTRDDGPCFCLIDADIIARSRFLPPFLEALGEHAAVSSGRGVWTETDVVPAGHPGVNGEYFWSPGGFLFGSPHFAIYRRAPLEETTARWGIGFGSAGPELSDAAKERLRRAGIEFWLYDTGKLVNAFLQLDGHQLCHFEHDALLHVGGVSHYLAPPAHVVPAPGAEPEPDWARWKGMAARFEVARFTAQVLQARASGCAVPDIPAGLDPGVADRLVDVRAALIDVVDRYAAWT